MQGARQAIGSTGFNILKRSLLQRIRLVGSSSSSPAASAAVILSVFSSRIRCFSSSSSPAPGIEEQGFESTTISDVLTSKGKSADGSWLWCKTDDTVYDAVVSMTQHNVGALMVVKPGEKNSIAGIITERAALNKGMNSYIFVFYRQAFATIFLVPLAIIFERKRAPPLSFVTFCKIFMFALFGITISLNVSGIALLYTTPSLVAAILNTLPAITFFLVVFLRMETVKSRSLSGGLKIFGVIVCLAGAATLALYKGPHLKPPIHHRIFGQASSPRKLVSSSSTWVKGCFLMLAANVLWGLWFVLQGMVLDSYPSKLLFTTLLCLFSTIQTLL